MVLGTHFVLTGSYSWTALLASLVPGFLVSDLLLLNQFPDMEADKTVGRNHLPILLGRKNVARIYIFFLATSCLPLFLGYALGVFPIHVFLALATTIIAVQTSRGVLEIFRGNEKPRPLSRQKRNHQSGHAGPARHRPHAGVVKAVRTWNLCLCSTLKCTYVD